MTWFRVDDGFSEHAKVDALGADQPFAVAAWTLCGSACARALTDGLVTRSTLARALVSWPANIRQRAASALVRVGLWVEDPEGWRFHDWEEFQPSRVTVESRREDGKRRKAEFDERRRNASPQETEERNGNALPHQPADAPPSRPVPTRPDPAENALAFSESARAPDALPHLLAEAKRVLGKAWASEKGLRAAWSGGGLRAEASRVAEAKAILSWAAETAPDIEGQRLAITQALNGFKAEPFAQRSGLSMSLFAREPGRYLKAGKALSSAPSDFSHVDESKLPAFLREETSDAR